MAASVRIEFDDGSRAIQQDLEGGASGANAADGPRDGRPSSCSIEDFYEASKHSCLARPAHLNFPHDHREAGSADGLINYESAYRL